MNWGWRAANTDQSLQCTSKALTKGAVKEAAMVEPSLLYTEFVLQAMKLIFSPCQKKSSDFCKCSLAQEAFMKIIDWRRYLWLSQQCQQTMCSVVFCPRDTRFKGWLWCARVSAPPLCEHQPINLLFFSYLVITKQVQLNIARVAEERS